MDGHLDRLVGGPDVAARALRRRLHRLGGQRGVGHAERREDLRLDQRRPVGGAHRLRQHPPGQHVGDVGVGEGRAEARRRLDVAQRADHRRLVEADEAEDVVGGRRQAGALRQQVEDPELARHPRILELEVRVEVDDAVVPGELAPVDADRERGGEERLGGRADLEDGRRIDRRPALPGDAEALAPDQPVAADDADGDAGGVEVRHALGDVGLEVGHQRLDLRIHRRVGPRLPRVEQRQRRRHQGSALHPPAHRKVPLLPRGRTLPQNPPPVAEFQRAAAGRTRRVSARLAAKASDRTRTMVGAGAESIQKLA